MSGRQKELFYHFSAIVLVALIFWLTGCKPQSSVQSCNYIKNVYGQHIIWRGHLPMVFTINSYTDTYKKYAIYEAANVWNRAAGKRLIHITENVGPIAFGRNNVNTITFESLWAPDRKSELGSTRSFWANNNILENDIRINVTYFTFSPTSKYNLVGLLTHEMGHALGIEHDNNYREGSIMTPENKNVLKLNAQNIKDLKCEY